VSWSRLFQSLSSPFRAENRIAWPVIGAFLFVNAMVLLNAVLHDPKFGYDASAHLKYATTLARTGWLPTAADTHEFFSPPLPYVPLALLWMTLDASRRDADVMALKLAQLFQFGCSIVLTFFLIKLARLARGGTFVATAALLLLGMVPAYYRTFAMIRGEPLLATLAVVGTYLTLKTFAINRPTLGAAAGVGLTLGLAVLSRQWAFFLLPALGLVGLWRLIADRHFRGATLRAGVVTIVTFLCVGGPFYLHLHRTSGSMRAFNRAPETEEVVPPDGEKAPLPTMFKRLTTRPIRDSLIHHPVAVFYADVWGDYWQYYLVYAKESYGKGRTRYAKPVDVERTARRWPANSNYATMPAYLGRACVGGAVPTALFVGGVGWALYSLRALRRDAGAVALPTLAMCVVTTIAGYVWFVASYPSDEGDTIKASYPLQLYAPLAILGAVALADMGKRWPRVGLVVVALLIIVGIHNLQACVTRYW
jgi:hypothetical protein